MLFLVVCVIAVALRFVEIFSIALVFVIEMCSILLLVGIMSVSCKSTYKIETPQKVAKQSSPWVTKASCRLMKKILKVFESRFFHQDFSNSPGNPRTLAALYSRDSSIPSEFAFEIVLKDTLIVSSNKFHFDKFSELLRIKTSIQSS